jgi:hypothetical protein
VTGSLDTQTKTTIASNPTAGELLASENRIPQLQ